MTAALAPTFVIHTSVICHLPSAICTIAALPSPGLTRRERSPGTGSGIAPAAALRWIKSPRSPAAFRERPSYLSTGAYHAENQQELVANSGLWTGSLVCPRDLAGGSCTGSGHCHSGPARGVVGEGARAVPRSSQEGQYRPPLPG